MAEFDLWDGRTQVGDHKYAKMFLRDGHQVFWIANFMNANRLVRRREDDLGYLRAWRRGVEKPLPGLSTFCPFAWLPYVKAPLFDNSWLAERFMRYTTPSISHTLAANGFDQVDVLWIGNPRLYSLASIVPHRLLVYRMRDDVEHFTYEPRSIGQVERLLCGEADAVFAVGSPLLAKAQRYTSKAYPLPNGVDFEIFNSPNLPIPEDLALIPPPRLLYVGAIADWFDFEAVETIAEGLPECSIVLIGPVMGGRLEEMSLNRLSQFPNVHVMGSRPFARVPAYMHHSQVALIPFVANPMTHLLNPIKLFEYCAAGLPVVSRRLSEMVTLKSPALFYETSEELLAAVRQALASRDELGRTGVEFGRANTWEHRYRELKRHVEHLMEGRERRLPMPSTYGMGSRC